MKTRDSVSTQWGLSGIRRAMGRNATQCAQREQRTRTNEATTPIANDASCARCGTVQPIEDPECRRRPQVTRGNATAHEARPKLLGSQTQHQVSQGPRWRHSCEALRTPETITRTPRATQYDNSRACLDGRSAILSDVATRAIHASIRKIAISIHCRWMSWAWS